MKTTTKLLLCAASTIAFTGTAQAQLIGACPSLISPPPCIIFDYKKLADIATQNSQELQKIKGAVDQITEMKNTAQSFGSSLAGNNMVGIEKVIQQGETDNHSVVPQGTVDKMATDVAKMVYGGDKNGITLDKARLSQTTKDYMTHNASANAFAVSGQSCQMAKQSIRKIKELEKAAQKTKDFRGDWLANSQIRLEIDRINAQKNYLLSTLLQHQASESSKHADKSLQPEQSNTSYGQEAAAAPVDPAWEKNKILQVISGQIQNLLNSASLATSATDVLGTLKGQATNHQTSLQKRDGMLNQLASLAQQLAGQGGQISASSIMNMIVSGLTRTDNQMASLRAQPISGLSGEFSRRNIDVAQMTANNVDPREFLGTWSDPLKAKMTLDMANSMITGPLRQTVKGQASIDAFRKAVIDYNNARLEEAWNRQLAEQAKPLIAETGDMVSAENKSAGINLADKAAVTSELQRLVTEANTLAQGVGKSSDPAAKAEATAIVKLIQGYISGKTADQSAITASYAGATTTPASMTSMTTNNGSRTTTPHN